ncbi:hypothetical protein EGW08_023630 [Elysia chlorotica]|uniref:Uncharacterized protein n=1 Tax=Elysia chlorotica TaxID=188477 RepID=A0A3S0Z1E1_ELYCH|nr:hypothetical protein EGW08_023630 [Elysia chlorotica]
MDRPVSNTTVIRVAMEGSVILQNTEQPVPFRDSINNSANSGTELCVQNDVSRTGQPSAIDSNEHVAYTRNYQQFDALEMTDDDDDDQIILFEGEEDGEKYQLQWNQDSFVSVMNQHKRMEMVSERQQEEVSAHVNTRKGQDMLEFDEGSNVETDNGLQDESQVNKTIDDNTNVDTDKYLDFIQMYANSWDIDYNKMLTRCKNVRNNQSAEAFIESVRNVIAHILHINELLDMKLVDEYFLSETKEQEYAKKRNKMFAPSNLQKEFPTVEKNEWMPVGEHPYNEQEMLSINKTKHKGIQNDKMGCVSCSNIVKCVCLSCFRVRKCIECFSTEGCGFQDAHNTCENKFNKQNISFVGSRPTKWTRARLVTSHRGPLGLLDYFSIPNATDMFNSMMEYREKWSGRLYKSDFARHFSCLVFARLTNFWSTERIACSSTGCNGLADFMMHHMGAEKQDSVGTERTTSIGKFCTPCAVANQYINEKKITFGEHYLKYAVHPVLDGAPYAKYLTMTPRKNVMKLRTDDCKNKNAMIIGSKQWARQIDRSHEERMSLSMRENMLKEALEYFGKDASSERTFENISQILMSERCKTNKEMHCAISKKKDNGSSERRIEQPSTSQQNDYNNMAVERSEGPSAKKHQRF